MTLYTKNTLILNSLIPDIADGQSFGTNSSYSMAYLFAILLVFFVLLFLFTKIFSKRSFFVLKSKYMEIIDRMPLSHDKQLIILKIFDEIYLVAVSQNSFTLIDKLDFERFQIKDTEIKDIQNVSFKNFSDILSILRKNKKS